MGRTKLFSAAPGGASTDIHHWTTELDEYSRNQLLNELRKHNRTQKDISTAQKMITKKEDNVRRYHHSQENLNGQFLRSNEKEIIQEINVNIGSKQVTSSPWNSLCRG